MNRLKLLRQNAKLYQIDVANAINISRSAYTTYENGTRDIPTDILRKLAEYYNTTVDYILGLDTIQSNLIWLKIYGRVSAGSPNLCEEDFIGLCPVDMEALALKNPEGLFFLKINGNSMNKIIKNGALALIRKQDTCENGDIVVVAVNDEATIKKISFKEDFIFLEPCSTDENYQTQIYSKKDKVRIIGKYLAKFEFYGG